MNTDCEAKFSTTTAPAQRRPRPERQRAPRRSIVHNGPARKRGLRPLPAGGRVNFEPDHRWERNGRAAGGEHVGMLEQQLELRRPLAECVGLHVEPLAECAGLRVEPLAQRAGRAFDLGEPRMGRALPGAEPRAHRPDASFDLDEPRIRGGMIGRKVPAQTLHCGVERGEAVARAALFGRDLGTQCGRRLRGGGARGRDDFCREIAVELATDAARCSSPEGRPPCLRLRSARYVPPIVILVQVLMGRNRFRSRRRGAAARRAKAGEPAIHEHERRSRHSACVPRPVVMDSGFALRAPRNDSSVSRPDRPARAARGAPAPRSRASRSAAPRAA